MVPKSSWLSPGEEVRVHPENEVILSHTQIKHLVNKSSISINNNQTRNQTIIWADQEKDISVKSPTLKKNLKKKKNPSENVSTVCFGMHSILHWEAEEYSKVILIKYDSKLQLCRVLLYIVVYTSCEVYSPEFSNMCNIFPLKKFLKYKKGGGNFFPGRIKDKVSVRRSSITCVESESGFFTCYLFPPHLALGSIFSSFLATINC